MTDWEDLADTAWVGSMASSGPISLVFFALFLIFTLLYFDQADDCSKKHCEPPAHTQVVKGECVCLAPAGP